MVRVHVSFESLCNMHNRSFFCQYIPGNQEFAQKTFCGKITPVQLSTHMHRQLLRPLHAETPVQPHVQADRHEELGLSSMHKVVKMSQSIFFL